MAGCRSLTTDEVVTEPPESSEANLFELEGEGVQIIYGILRRRREFLDYRDEQCDPPPSSGTLAAGRPPAVHQFLQVI